ncbi:MAG: pyridoxal-phosphate dependent enzyme [Alphaproteobacteria bacterium]|nr:pyridoxal-phosphate dependent enzyme [Alphaproteobacteria bacterium]
MSNPKASDLFSPDPAHPLALLAACPAYAETPLREIAPPGLPSLLVKDETARMGLGSFKALGGVYAVARHLAEAYGARTGTVPAPSDHTGAPFREAAAETTFVCASAGNHGLSVAAGARIFGAKARIHLAATVPESFADRLRGKDAQVVRSGSVYDEAVAIALKDAEETGAILLADGSWPGYTRLPAWVMEGYTVIPEELRRHFAATGRWPTHVFVQAGVGGIAAAMAHQIRAHWPAATEIVVVEPSAARCLAASHAAGKPVTADGPVSNMSRLDCKDPSLLAFHALEAAGVRYTDVSDDEAEEAVRDLRALGIGTSPSGAAGLAGLRKTALPEGARPLIVATETVIA